MTMTTPPRALRVLLTFVVFLNNALAGIAADKTSPVHLVGHEDLLLLDRVQDLIDDWDPRKLTNPIFETTEDQRKYHQSTPSREKAEPPEIVRKRQLKRSDLAQFIADVEATEVLGKALFWEMQAGSDFRSFTGKDADGKPQVYTLGTACATCHYRNGADARTRHSMRIPYVAWDQYYLDKTNHPLEFGEKQLPFDVKKSATTDIDFKLVNVYGKLSMTVGSAGVEPRYFLGLNSKTMPPSDGSTWYSENHERRKLEFGQPNGYKFKPQWSMFLIDQKDGNDILRQITPRNSPTVINSGFADRQFHDGRAESTFNGFSMFGDRDQKPVIYRGTPQRDASGRIRLDAQGREIYGKPIQVKIAITNASLASQAVVPVMNDLEMSYLGRTFPNLACKLLDEKILAYQKISDDDSVLGPWKKRGLIGANGSLTYRDLIRIAFRREWWDSGIREDKKSAYTVPLILMAEPEADGTIDTSKIPEGSLMHANFSLYWGLSIMFYESSLVSNQSPFDGMMQGNPTLVEKRWNEVKGQFGTISLDRSTQDGVNPPPLTTGSAVFQYGFRVFMNRGCIECHAGPLFSEVFDRLPENELHPIHERLSNTLFPNSRADAIARAREKYHDRKLAEVAALLEFKGNPTYPLAQRNKLARSLDTLREQARGNAAALQQLIEQRLPALQTLAAPKDPSAAKEIAKLLLEFERRAPLTYGSRTFFHEDERLDMAEQLVEPVFVESMAYPPRQARQRPLIPYLGRFGRNDYAFYDLGFYALGLSPPRYDWGIGDYEPPTSVAPILDQASTTLIQEIEAAQRLPPETRGKDDMLKNLQQQASELREYRDQQLNPNALVAPVIQPVPDAIQKRLQDAAKKVAEQKRPNPATPGRANRFQPLPQRVAPSKGPQTERTCKDGPSKLPDLDEKKLEPEDHSWDRNFLPDNVRRSDVIFKSRARTLVTDEDPWGYRKPLLHDNELAFWGAFKTPTLRNVELTAPYMHNGNLENLDKVIDFYDDAGFIEIDRNLYPDKNPEIVSLDMKKNDKLALRFFLLCLTDERVRLEQAPFDHPSLWIVNGYVENRNKPRERIQLVPESGNIP